MTTEELIRSLYNLRPGERIIYFIGFLDKERYDNPTGKYAAVAQVAQDLAERGLILLIQERISPPLRNKLLDWTFGIGGGFRYWAVGSKQKEKIVFHNRPVRMTGA